MILDFIFGHSVLNYYYFQLDTLVQEHISELYVHFLVIFTNYYSKKFFVIFFLDTLFIILLFLVGHSGSRTYTRTHFLVPLFSPIIIKDMLLDFNFGHPVISYNYFQLDTLVQEHIPELYVHFQSQVNFKYTFFSISFQTQIWFSELNQYL